MRPIDADALIREFAEFVRASNNSDFADVPTWNDAVSLLGSAPTIEPKRGKWEDVEEDEGEWICFKCSECGHDAYSYTGEILSNEWKFCPYCGAKMESE